MSLRLEMLQIARLAPKLLLDSTGLVEKFILSQVHEQGGFTDRAGQSDLYYTVFGIESLIALQSHFPLANFVPYLESFGTGETLDFVHLACLARAWANVSRALPDEKTKQAILDRMESYRSSDGGYAVSQNEDSGTAYACFLALGAYQDFVTPLPNTPRLLDSLSSLKAADGAFANERNRPVGLTSPTAAVVVALRHLGAPEDPALGEWLLQRCHPQGGFCAAPQTPMPDLLSTATALHALASAKVSFEHIKNNCLDFIDSLWVNQGSFYANWADDTLDCEYTYYGLLALGHLSL